MTVPTTVAELLAQPTPQDNLRALFAFLTLQGLPATSWQSGSVPRTLLAAEAEWLSDLAVGIALVAKGGYLDDAEDDWLTLLARSLFQLERLPAVAAVGDVILTDAANAGPFSIDQGSIIVSDGSRTLRFQYSENLTKTLPLGGSAPITVQAETAGAAYNVANGALTVLLTAVPGVTVTNPAQAGTTTWLATQGQDTESDEALRTRCRARWATQGTGALEESYEFWALSVPGVTRPTVTNDPTTGIVTVSLAGPSGPVGYTVVAAVQAILDARRPLTVRALAADTLASNTLVNGIVYVSPGFDLVATLAAVALAVDAVARATPVGGTILRDRIIQVAMETPGVRDLDLAQPAANVGLAAGTVFVPVYTLTGAR